MPYGDIHMRYKEGAVGLLEGLRTVHDNTVAS